MTEEIKDQENLVGNPSPVSTVENSMPSPAPSAASAGGAGLGTDYVIYEDHRVAAPGQLTGLSVSTIATMASEDGGIGNIYTVTVPSPDAVLQADALTCSYAPELRARMSFVLKGAEGEGSAAARQASVLALLERCMVIGAQALRFWPTENARAIQGSELVYPIEHAAPGAHLDIAEARADQLDHSVLPLLRTWLSDILVGSLQYNSAIRVLSRRAYDMFRLLHLPEPGNAWALVQDRDGENAAEANRAGLYVLDDVLTITVDTLLANAYFERHPFDVQQPAGPISDEEAARRLMWNMDAVEVNVGALRPFVVGESAYNYDANTDEYHARARPRLNAAAEPLRDDRGNYIHWAPEIGLYSIFIVGDDEQVYMTWRCTDRTSRLNQLVGAALTYTAIAEHETRRGYVAEGEGYDHFATLAAHIPIGVPANTYVERLRDGQCPAIATCLSGEFFMLPVSVDVVGRVAQAIADYFIAVRLVQLFPHAELYVRDIRTIPQTAEAIQDWLHQPLMRVTIHDVENIEGTYTAGRDVCMNTSYTRYVAPLAQLSNRDALERPELRAIRAYEEFELMARTLAQPHKIIEGQLILADLPADTARDVRLSRFIEWVRVMRQVMNAPAEINRGDWNADSLLRQANAYAEAMDCYCALERYMLHASAASKAFARTVRVDSAVPNHFTIAGQDVVFAQTYHRDHRLSLGNGTYVPYLHPDYQHSDDRRLSVNAVPGQRGTDAGLLHQVLVRTQRPAEHQLNWINTVPLDTGISTAEFARVYQVLMEQVVPTTIFGSNFRPWREQRQDNSWERQLMQRTAVGRLSRLISSIPGIVRQGVCGIMFPVTVGSCQSGAIQAHFVNNTFQVKVLNDKEDVSATPGAIFAYDEQGRPVGGLADRLHTMQPASGTYPLPQDVARY